MVVQAISNPTSITISNPILVILSSSTMICLIFLVGVVCSNAFNSVSRARASMHSLSMVGSKKKVTVTASHHLPLMLFLRAIRIRTINQFLILSSLPNLFFPPFFAIFLCGQRLYRQDCYHRCWRCYLRRYWC